MQAQFYCHSDVAAQISSLLKLPNSSTLSPKQNTFIYSVSVALQDAGFNADN